MQIFRHPTLPLMTHLSVASGDGTLQPGCHEILSQPPCKLGRSHCSSISQPIPSLYALQLYILVYMCVYIYICTRPCHPPSPPWDGSHILAPYEIFPLPPLWCGGVWHCPPPPLWCGGGVVWYVGYVWCVWSVWYGMFGKYGMFGRYGMYGMYGMNGWCCM